jgi:hypothetical protein
MLVIREHIVQKTAPTMDTDWVFSFIPIPDGGKVAQIHMDVQVTAVEDLALIKSCMYTMSGYLIEIPDPDTPEGDPNTYWDRQVPKTGAYGDVIDLSIDTPADQGLTDSPGKLNVTELMSGFSPVQVFERNKILHSTDPLAAQTGADLWRPTDRIITTINTPIRATRPSVLMFAFGSPNLGSGYDSFTGSHEQQWIPLIDSDWEALRRPKWVLNNWVDQAMGLVAAGTYEPIKQLFRMAEQIHVWTDGNIAEPLFDVNGKVTYHYVSPDAEITVIT